MSNSIQKNIDKNNLFKEKLKNLNLNFKPEYFPNIFPNIHNLSNFLEANEKNKNKIIDCIKDLDLESGIKHLIYFSILKENQSFNLFSNFLFFHKQINFDESIDYFYFNKIKDLPFLNDFFKDKYNSYSKNIVLSQDDKNYINNYQKDFLNYFVLGNLLNNDNSKDFNNKLDSFHYEINELINIGNILFNNEKNFYLDFMKTYNFDKKLFLDNILEIDKIQDLKKHFNYIDIRSKLFKNIKTSNINDDLDFLIFYKKIVNNSFLFFDDEEIIKKSLNYINKNDNIESLFFILNTLKDFKKENNQTHDIFIFTFIKFIEKKSDKVEHLELVNEILKEYKNQFTSFEHLKCLKSLKNTEIKLALTAAIKNLPKSYCWENIFLNNPEIINKTGKNSFLKIQNETNIFNLMNNNPNFLLKHNITTNLNINAFAYLFSGYSLTLNTLVDYPEIKNYFNKEFFDKILDIYTVIQNNNKENLKEVLENKFNVKIENHNLINTLKSFKNYLIEDFNSFEKSIEVFLKSENKNNLNDYFKKFTIHPKLIKEVDLFIEFGKKCKDKNIETEIFFKELANIFCYSKKFTKFYFKEILDCENINSSFNKTINHLSKNKDSYVLDRIKNILPKPIFDFYISVGNDNFSEFLLSYIEQLDLNVSINNKEKNIINLEFDNNLICISKPNLEDIVNQEIKRERKNKL